MINLKINECDNVIPLNLAISDKPDELSLGFKGKTFESKADSLANVLKTLDIDPRSIRFMKMDIEGGEHRAIPSNLEIIEKLDFLAIEIHGGWATKLILFMDKLGFDFHRVNRRSYLVNAFKSFLLHPGKVFEIYKLIEQSGEFPVIGKIFSGIEISSSDDIVVGRFVKRKEI